MEIPRFPHSARQQLQTARPPNAQQNKSRRLYVGNIPYHVGIPEHGMVQLFSALYVAAFGPLAPSQPLPVASFWLHSDGKFGFMELRGDAEAVHCMAFNGLVLHGRPLRVNRPSDFRPELAPPSDNRPLNARAVLELCNALDGIVGAPPPILAAAAMAPPAPAPQAPFAAPLNLRSQPPPVASPSPQALTPSKPSSGKTVLALEHLVTNDDLDAEKEDYDDLVADITEECSSYGAVVDVSIPRDGPGRGTAYIAYKTLVEAETALTALRERSFNGQLIKGVIVAGYESAAAAATAPRVYTGGQNKV